MREFIHHGEPVIYQQLVDECFLDLLNKEGIFPEEIPDENLEYRVFKYCKNGQKRYACVIQTIAPDAHVEKVFITLQFPEDGFEKLMLDVCGQLEKEAPSIMRSRLSIANEQAERVAREWVEKQFPEQKANMFLEYPEEIQKEYDKMRKFALNRFGYDLETLDQIQAPDVDMEYMRSVLR